MSILRNVLLICTLALTLPAAAEDAAPSGANAQMAAGQLYEALASAGSASEARDIEIRLFALWAHTESPSEALILRQATELTAQGAFGEAREKLDALTEIAPDYVEGWSLRALVHRELGNHTAAVSDLRHVLEIEPRHFLALMLLGSIFEETGQPRSALKAWKTALEINPHLEGGAETVRRLTHEVEGRGI